MNHPAWKRLARSVCWAGVLLMAACSSDGEQADESASWQLVFEDLPGALLSVWGTSDRDVWSVGGDPGDGTGPLVLHFDGRRWERRSTGSTGDLWWVYGFADGPVYMGGKEGTILKYQDGAFDEMDTPGSNTVFGLWGEAADDMWAVGGQGATPSGGFAWRSDGTSWREADGVPDALESSATLFKVWGAAADDIWFVGTDGTLAHYDGASFESDDAPGGHTLFTVHGDGKRTYAVGGEVEGVILENSGSGWKDVAPHDTSQLSGVCAGANVVYAAGINGALYRREQSGWQRVETGLSIREDLHSVWIDPKGGVWSVGGQVLSQPLVRGVMAHRGPKVSGGDYDEP
ncbi:MAG TPA: hypothetical protein VJV78_42795 [Polyangiales bacterium]|nr:hypothetical protein [Polyangiales bacterium]